MLAELIGGYLTGSLALMADAVHMLSDAAALALSLFALYISRRPPTAMRTWGYYRTEILAALANGATLLAISVYIFLEAWDRLWAPQPVQGGLMLVIAVGGLAMNLIGMGLLQADKEHSLNVRGAWLHLLTDALGSLGVLMAGGLIVWTGLTIVDPLVSVLIGCLVVYSAWSLLKEAVGVLMEGAPLHLDMDAVRDAMAAVPGVAGVHDLHAWSITSGLECLSGHVELQEQANPPQVLNALRQLLLERFNLTHVTLQLEPLGAMTRCSACQSW